MIVGISTLEAESLRHYKIFTSALENRYGAAKDLRDYAMKSQLMAYEGQRAMFEGLCGKPVYSQAV